MTIVQYVGNRSPSLAATIADDNGAAFDLTAASVAFQARLIGAPTLVINTAATIVNTPGTDGKVRYDWATIDVATARVLLGWWRVTLANGKTQDTPEFVVRIVDHAPVDPTLGGYYTTPDAVRAALGVTTTELDEDAALELILKAEDITDSMLGGWPTDATTGRKIVQADATILAWQWTRLSRFVTLLAERIYNDPDVLNGWQYQMVEGPDFRFRGIKGHRLGAYLIAVLDATGLRRLAPVRSVSTAGYAPDPDQAADDEEQFAWGYVPDLPGWWYR